MRSRNSTGIDNLDLNLGFAAVRELQISASLFRDIHDDAPARCQMIVDCYDYALTVFDISDLDLRPNWYLVMCCGQSLGIVLLAARSSVPGQPLTIAGRNAGLRTAGNSVFGVRGKRTSDPD